MRCCSNYVVASTYITGVELVKSGEVWPAISQLMTWAYGRVDPSLVWDSIERHLYYTHASVFPGKNMRERGDDSVATN